jgi:hypothetical protein
MKIIIIAVSTVFICTTATAKPPRHKYEKDIFSLSLLHFDASRAPHGMDWYLSSPEGKAILESVATAFGIAPAYVALASAAIPPPAVQGAQTDYRLPLVTGYVPCAARITVTSINPGDTPVSTINAAINEHEIQMTTVTPPQGLGGPNAWAEGDIAYYGIKPKYLDEFVKKGVCKPVAKQEFLLHCRTRYDCNAGAVWGNPVAAARNTAALQRDITDRNPADRKRPSAK